MLKKTEGMFYHGIPGVFSLADLPRYPSVAKTAWSSGYWELDQIWQPYPAQFTLLHGPTNHGKSSFLLNLAVKQWELGKRTFLFMPENERSLWERLSLIWGDRDGWEAFSEVGVMVGSSDRKYDETPRDLTWILHSALDAHRINKLDLLVLDPFNEVEMTKPRDWSESDFIGKCLQYVTGFCREFGLPIIMAAHPTKSGVQDGKVPGVYDVHGSAHFANKPDNVLCVWRDPKINETRIISQKVREIGGGKRGVCCFKVDSETGLFTPQYGGVTV